MRTEERIINLVNRRLKELDNAQSVLIGRTWWDHKDINKFTDNLKEEFR